MGLTHVDGAAQGKDPVFRAVHKDDRIVLHGKFLHSDHVFLHAADASAHLGQLPVGLEPAGVKPAGQLRLRQAEQLGDTGEGKAVAFQLLDFCEHRKLPLVVIAVAVFFPDAGGMQQAD